MVVPVASHSDVNIHFKNKILKLVLDKLENPTSYYQNKYILISETSVLFGYLNILLSEYRVSQNSRQFGYFDIWLSSYPEPIGIKMLVNQITESSRNFGYVDICTSDIRLFTNVISRFLNTEFLKVLAILSISILGYLFIQENDIQMFENRFIESSRIT